MNVSSLIKGHLQHLTFRNQGNIYNTEKLIKTGILLNFFSEKKNKHGLENQKVAKTKVNYYCTQLHKITERYETWNNENYGII